MREVDDHLHVVVGLMSVPVSGLNRNLWVLMTAIII